MRKLAGFPVVLLVVASTSAAQQTGEVGGTVYDSVGRAPLRNAVVHMVPPAGAPLYSATTDAHGRYSIRGVPPGRYFVEFQHHVLDSLALEPPLRSLEVHAGETTTQDLAVAAPATIVASTCKTSPADSTGLFFGMLRDSRTQMGLDSGQVTVRWFELVIDTSGLNNGQRFVAARSSRDGWFAMCGVPAAADVLVQASHADDSTGLSLVTVPPHGLVRFDLDVGGRARVRGRIMSRGRPVLNAQVRPAGTERAAYTDSSGAYRLTGVAAGTQTMEVRALGYAPQTAPTTLAPDSEAVLDVELTTVKRVMDTIQVVAQRLYSIDAVGFERRRRSAPGIFFDAEVVRRRGPYSVMQLLWEVPWLQVHQTGFDREVVMRAGRRSCIPTFFVNGMQMPGELLSELDLFVRPHELEGMEIYRSGATTPAEFRSGCGAIVVWTRRLPKPKR